MDRTSCPLCRTEMKDLEDIVEPLKHSYDYQEWPSVLWCPRCGVIRDEASDFYHVPNFRHEEGTRRKIPVTEDTST
jgi:rubredoxin